AGEADASTSTIAAALETITADGLSTSTVTVTLRDAHGNLVTGAGDVVRMATTAGSLDAVADNEDGTYSAVLRSSETAGTATVSFTVDGAAGDETVDVTFAAGAPSTVASTISADPATITADEESTSTVTVTLLDVHGNPVTGAGDVVELATTAGSLGEVTDHEDGTYTATLTSSKTAGTATVSFTVDDEDATATADVLFAPGAASAATSTIAADPATITADGTSTSTVTVTLRDGNGNALTSAGGVVTMATDAGTLADVTDRGDGTTTATLRSATTAGTATVTFAVDGVDAEESTEVDFTAGAASAATSTIAASPASITAGGAATSTVTVTLLDAHGNPVGASGGTVLMSTDAGSLGAVTDHEDGTYSAALTSATAAGTATVTFTLGGVAAEASTQVAFTAGAVDLTTSTIVADPTTLTADGASTSTVTVRLLDAHGNPVATAGDVVELATTAGDLSDVTDQGEGVYTATLRSSTDAGTATVTFTVDGEDAEASADVAFVAGAVDLTTSTIVADPTTLTADGAATSTVTVTLLDAHGNPVATAGDVVEMATTAGGLSDVTDQGEGVYTATLTSSTDAETATVTFTVAGEDAEKSVEVAFVAGEASVGTSTIEADPATITADGAATSTVTVTLLDAHGNPVGASGGKVTMSTTAGGLGTVTDHQDGTYSATLTSATTAGTATVSFALEGEDADAEATVRFVAGTGDATTSTIEADPTSITADGTTTSTITVTVRDAHDNLVTDGAAVELGTTAGTLGDVEDQGDGTWTATLTSSTTAGTATVTFTVGGQEAEDSAAVTFTAGAPDAATSTVEADPTAITADGESTSTITVTLRDAHGNVVPGAGEVVVMASDLGDLSGVTDVTDGTYTAVLTSDPAAGTATVTFTVDGEEAEKSVEVAFVAGEASVGTSTIAADPASITADGTSTSTVTVTLLDAHRNPVGASGGTVTMTTTAGELGEVTDHGDGTYTSVLTSAREAGTATVSFALDGADAEATTDVAFVAGPAVAGRSTIGADPATITADGASTSTVTVTLRDAYGNPLTASGGVVTMTTDAGDLSDVEDEGDGTYTATLTSTTLVQTATIGFALDGADAEDTTTVRFVADAPDASTSQIAADPVTITADGESTSTVTVTLRDGNDNLVTGAGDVVALATDAGRLSDVKDEGDGTYTATLTSSTTAGTATVTFAVDGEDADATTEVRFVAGAAHAGSSTIVADPGTITADGTSTSTVTVTLRDAYGNPLTASGGKVAMATDAGTLSAVTDNGDGTSTAVLESATSTGTATVTFTVDGEDGGEAAEVRFVAGEADATTSQIEADPTTITADGSATSTVTVTLRDAHDNLVKGAGDVVSMSTDAGELGPVTDQGDGTYTAVLTSWTEAGTATVSFAVAGTGADETAEVEFVAGTASATTSTIAADPVTITADGSSSSTVTVTLRDVHGNLVKGAGDVVAMSTKGGTLSGVTDQGDGTYTATLTSSTSAGTGTVSFEVDGDAGKTTATVAFVAGAADPGSSSIEASPTTLTADGTSTSTVTVTLVDAHGNPLTTSGGAVTLTTDAGTLSDVTDHGDGTYTATLTSSRTAGTATVTFAVDGDAGGSVDVRFAPGAASAATSTIAADPTHLTADGESTSTITVTLLDAHGNPLGASGGTVTMSSGEADLSGVTDRGDGTYTATLTAPTTTEPPAATVTFTVGGTTADATATVTFEAGVPSTTTSTIEADPAEITADGSSTSALTVRLRDGHGNPVTDAGDVVTMATTAGSLSGVTHQGGGVYTATLTSATAAGTASVSFAVDGAGGSAPALVTFVPGAPDASQATVEASATDGLVADGESASTVTVTLYDAHGNRVTTGGASVALSAAGGDLSDVTDHGDGTYTATLTSTTAGTATVSASVGGTSAGSVDVTFRAGAPSGATSEITATKDTIENDGVEGSEITVTLRDAHGNPIAAADVAISSTIGSVSDVRDDGNGDYTATLTSRTTGIATVSFSVGGTVFPSTVDVEVKDETPPAAPIITSPADGSSVPVRPVVSGTGEPGATVTVVAASGTVLGTATVGEDGTWTLVTTRALPEGPTTLTATQADAAGNVSGESAPVTVTVDDTPPPAPVPNATNGKDVSGTSEPGTTVTVRDTGGNVLCVAETGADGTFRCTPDTPIPAGTLLVLTATDEAGNVSEESFVRVGGPTLTLELDVAERGDTQVAHGGGFLPGEEVSGVLTSTPVDLGAQTADATGAVTFTVTLPEDLEAGTHHVTLTGDASGDVRAAFEVVVPAPDEEETPAAPAGGGGTSTPGRPAGPATVPAPSADDPDRSSGWLPRTGADVAGLAGLALLLTLLGAALVRRRRGGQEDGAARGGDPTP
ncbi:invasin domain 3-containing protein, partial [Isoptericola sp. NPDC019693]|uniref:invasin domain 3-containing protein n=1 Tax=Isoptericola sp. NPDC019693 TaxID=3364009 RepID=UPI003792AD7A